MPETADDLQERLRVAVTRGFRERLLDQGLARGLIWRDGVLPEGAPAFPATLTTDLLDYGYVVLALALRLRTQDVQAAGLERAFLVAGEAIEAAVHRGAAGLERGFHRVAAAVAFHLARYAARAYSVLPRTTDDVLVAGENLAPGETALVQLLRRRLDEMRGRFGEWLLAQEHEDDFVALRLRADDGFDEADAVHTVLTTAFMRGLALFDHAIATGDQDSAARARAQLTETAGVAGDLHAVNHWWTSTLASHLIDELWQLSLHQRIPQLAPGEAHQDRWMYLRRNYIQRLRADRRAAIELWPSQLDAVRRAVDPSDDLVVALPTSAGKTRIAELCILRALADGRRAVYVTPLRALSAQVERDLADTFVPLGFSVSALYGSAGIESGDAKPLREGSLVVSTPEKLDFALRNDESIIDDVGVIVLDEGHMLGPGEREVRYEALVQRLLRRADSESRRIVCLSALFPAPGDMADLVAWIRQDAPGEAVHSTWRPTRQRFGTLVWRGESARLQVRVEDESPYLSQFITARHPSMGSRRKLSFPKNKNELTLAAAWRFVKQEQDVLVYCALRKSVESLGKEVIRAIQQGLLSTLSAADPRIQEAVATGTEWLGAEHPAVVCLRHGVALHHGGLPRQFLNKVEGVLRQGLCRVTIASPTLAQGLNLAASVLLVPSIWRKGEVIPAAEFANVAGRAGRAFVDLEGLVVHIVWEATHQREERALRNWGHLVTSARAPHLASGLLVLAEGLFRRLAQRSGVTTAEVLEYVTGHETAWVSDKSLFGSTPAEVLAWERDLASLDTAILALLDPETEGAGLGAALDDVLSGSLFERQLAQRSSEVQHLIRGFVAARASRIWNQSTPVRRRGYYAAGLGLAAGQFLDRHLPALVELLADAEMAITHGDTEGTAAHVVSFAEVVFVMPPFTPAVKLPAMWRDALSAWMEGVESADVIRMCGGEGVDFLQDAVSYRLPWAMEAVRVYATAVEEIGADVLRGVVAMGVEVGSSNETVITLLRNGLSSREAARLAVSETDAAFETPEEMAAWLRSPEIRALSSREDWPTEESHGAWIQFYGGEVRGRWRRWRRESQQVPVDWLAGPPAPGTPVVLEPAKEETGCRVLTPDFLPLGVTRAGLLWPAETVVEARAGDQPGVLMVEYFGPLSGQQGN